MSEKHTDAPSVLRAIYRRMWALLIKLAVANKVRALFARKDLLALEEEDFKQYERVDAFLEWAIRHGKITKVGEDGIYKANISPVHYLPDAVQPHIEDDSRLQDVMRQLARLADRTTHLVQGSDVELAFATASETDLSSQHVRVIVTYLVNGEYLRMVGENQYAIACVDSVSEGQDENVEAGHDNQSVGSRDVDKRKSDDGGAVSQSTPQPATHQRQRRRLRFGKLSELPGITLENLERFRLLFVATREGAFATDTDRRVRELGFVSSTVFFNGMVLLRKAGWIVPGKAAGRGWWRWSLDKVPRRWIENLSVNFVQEEVDQAVEEPYEVPAQDITETSETAVSLVDSHESVDDADVCTKTDSESQPDSTSQDGSEVSRLFSLLLASMVEGVYRKIKDEIGHLPEEIQILILKALIERLAM